MIRLVIAIGIAFSLVFSSSTSEAIRLKDITNVFGVRDNQLIGYGVVVGLEGTGDLSTNIFFNLQSVTAMLEKMGVKVPPAKLTQLKLKNAASVMVTSTLPPFTKTGTKVDVTVSSMGDCKSLQGGTLIMTPLKAANGEIYGVAQGPVSIGGIAAGRAEAGVQKNHPTVGRITGGALIEKEVDFDFQGKSVIKLMLKTPDFTTAMRIGHQIDMNFGEPISKAEDSGTVLVKIPDSFKEDSVRFISLMENVQVTPDINAKVVLAEKTGTIVMGADVRISTIAVSHGNLIIQIKEETIVSPPPPASGEAIQIVPRNRVTGKEGEDHLLVLPQGANIGEVVTALNSIGVKPKDLISILQAIKASGALQAELVIL
ncbi:MAG: flagellar basal body P-ring protein FlgI [Nitrospinae bacterium]|nr:flagellar basal body P-ring protein FlgI [Nitrospinota bacterium]